MKKSQFLGAVCAALSTLTTLSAQAVSVPAGLNPGDTYQLVFVTEGTTSATSTDIADYNNFVQGEASLNPTLTGTDIGVTYTAIGSTSTIDANTNALVTGPVYLVGGSLVATGYSDMWDGSILVPINKTQYGTNVSGTVRPWTGSDSAGTAGSSTDWDLGASSAQKGISDLTSGWLTNGGASVTTGTNPMYALSSVITAPVPVPAAVWLFGSGLLGLVGLARRKKA